MTTACLHVSSITVQREHFRGHSVVIEAWLPEGDTQAVRQVLERVMSGDRTLEISAPGFVPDTIMTPEVVQQDNEAPANFGTW